MSFDIRERKNSYYLKRSLVIYSQLFTNGYIIEHCSVIDRFLSEILSYNHLKQNLSIDNVFILSFESFLSSSNKKE